MVRAGSGESEEVRRWLAEDGSGGVGDDRGHEPDGGAATMSRRRRRCEGGDN